MRRIPVHRQHLALLLAIASVPVLGYDAGMKPAPHHVFKCAKCPTIINCWPHKAGTAVCTDCLAAVRRENGKRVGADQAPTVGSTREIRIRDGQTYRQVYRPAHPNAPKSGWVMEHRLIMEARLGRLLDPAEVVHHENRDGLDNRAENLTLEASKGAHLAAEHSAEGVAARMAAYPRCACGGRTAFKSHQCWPCWAKSQTCPSCGRSGRKMARRDMCHGCYKRLRAQRAATHHATTENIEI